MSKILAATTCLGFCGSLVWAMPHRAAAPEKPEISRPATLKNARAEADSYCSSKTWPDHVRVCPSDGREEEAEPASTEVVPADPAAPPVPGTSDLLIQDATPATPAPPQQSQAAEPDVTATAQASGDRVPYPVPRRNTRTTKANSQPTVVAAPAKRALPVPRAVSRIEKPNRVASFFPRSSDLLVFGTAW